MVDISASNHSCLDQGRVARMASLVQLYKKVESSLEGMEIPPCPGVLDQIFAESRQEEPDFMRLAALISEDIALAANLIKTVNSPYFRLQRWLTSVRRP